MNEKVKNFIKELLKYSIIIIVVLNLVSYYKSKDLNKDKLSYKNFELINGSKYTISKDKPLLIYFWASWCPICKFQSPNIEELSKDYQVITIVNQSGSKDEIERYLLKNSLSFKVVNDQFNTLSKNFNIEVFPTTLIYDKNGKLKFSDVGYTSTLSMKLKLWWSN